MNIDIDTIQLIVVDDTDCENFDFWVRIPTENGIEIEGFDGEDIKTLPGAVNSAYEKGLSPTHWVSVERNHINPLPASIMKDKRVIDNIIDGNFE